MSMKIEKKQLTEIAPDAFIVDASDLGIRPGINWPKVLITEMGNGQPLDFFYEDNSLSDGDLLSVTYKQRGDSELVVEILND